MNQTYCISSSQPPYESTLTIRAWAMGLQVERVRRAEEFLMKMILNNDLLHEKQMDPTRLAICRQPSPCWRQTRYLAGPKRKLGRHDN